MKELFKKMDKPVFLTAFTVCGLLILSFFIIPVQMGRISEGIFTFLLQNFKWCFVLAADGIIIFCLVLAFSKYGRIRLGKDTDKPEYSNLSWFAMMFSAGMGVGLIFFGVTEPMSHFMDPLTAQAWTSDAARESMYITFFHWGIHPWAIYASVALPFAYFHYRRQTSPLVSACITPLFSKKKHRVLDISVDAFTIVITLLGISISFGLGALQITSGLNMVFGIPNSLFTTICVIIAGTVSFTLSSMLGIEKGMKRLSDFNMQLAVAFILFVFIFGPTVYIINSLLEGIGGYLSNFVTLSFFTDAQQAVETAKGYDWMSSWTIFYWAMWILWSPFVGIFIAKISKGRTIREFITVVLLLPTLFSCIWFSVIGGSALKLSQNGSSTVIDAVLKDSTGGIFALLQSLPVPLISCILIMVSLAIFFITSADASTQVLVTMSCKGKETDSHFFRVLWSLLIGALTCMLVFSGGINAMQQVSVFFTLPYIIIIGLLLISLYSSLKKDENIQ
ncbi:BCCT family transporter [Eubacterium sp. 1001713B170207_170306_E7]|uniref:BCCT family transporter n=1 Tax=Eubacterium sp. 1001713B170207_170306_E7 TaxID=2787097 RepID=UPI00189A616F|nr:BCCT family transporter [Eubacterium sp. 1001713B170207_170306_E7]